MVDYKTKIEKLLKLAQSPNEHEAKAALLKAKELMMEHKISEAEVTDIDKQPKEKVIHKLTKVRFGGRNNPWIYDLADTIARNYCCTAARTSLTYKGQTYGITLYGFESDVQIAEAALVYALDVIEHYCKENFRTLYGKGYTWKQTTNMCNGYGIGFNIGLAQKFSEQYKANEEEWGLVVQQAEEVKDYVNQRVKTGSFGWGEKSGDYSAMAKGFKHGKAFDPERKRVS